MKQRPHEPARPDEPEVTQEEDVAVDRRDTDGEEMMKTVRNNRLTPSADGEKAPDE